jgi:hypothetical protein
MVDPLHKGRMNRSVVIIAIVAALGLLGVVTFTIVTIPQQAEAIGCRNLTALRVSEEKCYDIPNRAR